MALRGCSERLVLSRAGRFRSSPLATKRVKSHCFKTSQDIIRSAVIIYDRFSLLLHNIGDLLRERGIEISNETVLYLWNRFGPILATKIR